MNKSEKDIVWVCNKSKRRCAATIARRPFVHEETDVRGGALVRQRCTL